MLELTKIQNAIREKLGLEVAFYAENTPIKGVPVCDKPFETATSDGQYTYFRVLHRGTAYIGVLTGAGEEQNNYALLLPAYIEGFAERETELSKAEHLKRILFGECSSMSVYKYATKYSVKKSACFVIALYIPKLMDEAIALLEQYGGNSLDTAVQMSAQTCVLVRFLEGNEEDSYRASVDYAEFLSQSIKEELGLDVVKAKYMSSRYHSKKELLMLNFIVIVEEKPLKIAEEEIAEARWCTPEEAVTLIRKNTTAEFFLNNAVRELKKKI